MSEDLPSKEKKEPVFDRNDLTPFEHLMMGSSVVINRNGQKLMINDSILEEKNFDAETQKILLTPISLLEGKKSAEEVKLAREKGEVFSGGLSFFETASLVPFLIKGVNPTFKPGQLDENGQLDTFEIFLLQNEQQVELPENPTETLVVDKNFKRFVEYLGQENGKMKFRIRREIERKE